MNPMTKEYTLIIEKGEDGYFISEVVELPGCRSQAKTKKELVERTKKAIALCLDCQEPTLGNTFVGVQKIAV